MAEIGSEIRGFSRLTIDAITGITDLVEAMHHQIAGGGWARGRTRPRRARGISGLVYRSIRGATHVVGEGLDLLLGELEPLIGDRGSSPRREALLAVLNGVLGDHLAATENPLAISMRLRRDGKPLTLERQELGGAFPRAGRKLAVLVHGLCVSDLHWNRGGHDHGAALARDLGYTIVYLHYNSGRHVSANGRQLASTMEALVRAWPVAPELAILGHSVGGLVARSACHYGAVAGHEWLRRLESLVFLGTPHHGAPLERGGHWVDLALGMSPYSAPLGRLGRIRSAGITDLRFGSLVDADWQGRDRFARSKDRRRKVPLPDGVRCYAMAATTGKRVGDLRDMLLGDGLVPLHSALGRHPEPARCLPIPEARQWVGRGMGHMDLLSRPEVYGQILRWLRA